MDALITHWEMIASIASLLVSIGVCISTIRVLKKEVAEMKAMQQASSKQAHELALELSKQAMQLVSHESRIGAVEALQRSDHDVVTRMAQQVETIAMWVERQRS